MSCDKYLELLSARLDGELTRDEERELEAHLAVCPDCRAAGAQLAALQDAFDNLEDAEAPEGFAQGVMDRIRASETEKKIVPLFKRPQLRAVAGLAACAVLAVGLYGAAYSQRKSADEERFSLTVRSFNKNAVTEFADASDAPMYAAYSADQETPASEAREYGADREMQKTAQDELPCGSPDVEVLDSPRPVDRLADQAVLVLDRMPEGAEVLIPLETVVSYNIATGEEGYRWMTDGASEVLAQIERLAAEQGMSAERSSLPAEELEYDLVLLEAAH